MLAVAWAADETLGDVFGKRDVDRNPEQLAGEIEPHTVLELRQTALVDFHP